MKKNLFFKFNVVAALFLLTARASAQTIHLGSLSNFTVFSTVGAISNVGKSNITGLVGTNAGAIAGFKTSVIADAIADDKAAGDLLLVVSTLNDITVANTLPSELGGSTLFPGTYSVSAAAAVVAGGTLTLDAARDPNAIFIIKINGAMATGAGATVLLLNGASSDNVFWQVQGAVALGANTTMVGNIIGSAAIAAGANCTINGRLLTSAGAIALNGGKVFNPDVPLATTVALASPALGSLTNLTLFTAIGALSDAGKSTLTGKVGTAKGAITGFDPSITITDQSIDDLAVKDLSNLVTALDDISTDATELSAVLSGTILPGVSSVGSAASIPGNLLLKGTATDVFIIQIGGALTSAAGATITLDGVNPDNVFWQVDGAVALGAGTTMAGNIVGSGAITAAANCTINGRFFTTVGAIAISGLTSSTTMQHLIGLEAFTVFSDAGSIVNTGNSDITGLVGTATGNISGFKNAQIASSDIENRAAAQLKTLVEKDFNMPCTNVVKNGILRGTFKAGVYCSGTGNFALRDNITFDGENRSDANSNLWLFQSDSYVLTQNLRGITFINGAKAENIYFIVNNDVTITAYQNIVGNIISKGNINVFGNASINGKLLTTNGNITLKGLQSVTNITSTTISTKSSVPLENSLTETTNNTDKLGIYPNPVYDKINLSFSGNKSQIISTEIYNQNLVKVYAAKGYMESVSLPLLIPGVYIVLLHTPSKTIKTKFILLKK